MPAAKISLRGYNGGMVLRRTPHAVYDTLYHLEAVWKQSLFKTISYAASVVRPKTELLENRSHIMLLEISNHLIY